MSNRLLATVCAFNVGASLDAVSCIQRRHASSRHFLLHLPLGNRAMDDLTSIRDAEEEYRLLRAGKCRLVGRWPIRSDTTQMSALFLDDRGAGEVCDGLTRAK